MRWFPHTERVLLACAVSSLSAAAPAHHSPAAYDIGSAVTIEGTVVDLDWRNPHVYFTQGFSLVPLEAVPGVLVHEDGAEATQRRIATASRRLPDFGIATECGIARQRTGETDSDTRRVVYRACPLGDCNCGHECDKSIWSGA
jgi:hypothetical protein